MRDRKDDEWSVLEIKFKTKAFQIFPDFRFGLIEFFKLNLEINISNQITPKYFLTKKLNAF